MKQIVKFQIVKPQGRVTIDANNPELAYIKLEDMIEQLLPFTRLFKHITIKNFTRIPEALVNRLTNQYLHGASIQFCTPNRQFDKTYTLRNARPFYSYSWQPLDLSKPVPKSLANFVFDYNGKSTTYLDAIKTLSSTRYLPNEIWVALDKYSQQQIAKCREYNQGDYGYAEEWYKDLMKDCIHSSIKVFSPNEKTYYEVMAEIDFEKDCADIQKDTGFKPLTQSELAYLRKYAPMYGVEVPQFMWRINTRKTNHGYTQEPERVFGGMSNSDWERVLYDSRNTNLPKNIRHGLNVKYCDNDKLLYDAYQQLKWIIDNLHDDGLMPGYNRCPVCGEIYRDSQGCECGACQPIHLVQADNMLYGISSTYEDYESTIDSYDRLSDIEGLL
jgi:hypothetical protein